MMRRLLILFPLAFVASRGSTNDLSQRETDLYEFVLDLNALVSTGISRNELRRRMPELNIKFDRYVRSGGEAWGSLYAVVKAVRDLEGEWDEAIRAKLRAQDYDPASRFKIEQLVDDGLQRHFGYVRKAITGYEEEKAQREREQREKEQRARQPKKGKK